MQSVTLNVVNSAATDEYYRTDSLDFYVPGSDNKDVTIELPTDAGFLVWVTAKTNLSGTISYGENDTRTVVVATGDYIVDPLDYLVVMDSANPQQITIPLATTLFDGDATGGTGNQVRIIRTSGVLTVEPSGAEKIDGNSVPAGVAGYLTAGTGATSVFGTWASVANGEFAVTIDNVDYEITGIIFTGAGSMAAVATIIQDAVRAATGSLETVVWSTNHFIVSSIVTRVSGNVSLLTAVAGGTGTDISGVGGVTYMDGDAGGTAAAATAGLGGYPIAATGSVLIQAMYNSYKAVGGTTAFS